MKQLSENPSEESERKGWKLMRACLECFAPSEELENYLELYLRTRGKINCLRSLHGTVFRGSRTSAPTIEQTTQV